MQAMVNEGGRRRECSRLCISLLLGDEQGQDPHCRQTARISRKTNEHDCRWLHVPHRACRARLVLSLER